MWIVFKKRQLEYFKEESNQNTSKLEHMIYYRVLMIHECSITATGFIFFLDQLQVTLTVSPACVYITLKIDHPHAGFRGPFRAVVDLLGKSLSLLTMCFLLF